MPSTDPVGDMISAIRNAIQRRKPKVQVPHSRIKEGVARVLLAEGYLADIKIVEDEVKRLKRKFLHVYIKYDLEGVAAVSGIKRVSTPGRRVFAPVTRFPKVLDGLGISVLSTSKGILSSRQAKKEKVGGELICNVW